jgi:UDP-2,3-diacylglucosamine hydrolase
LELIWDVEFGAWDFIGGVLMYQSAAKLILASAVSAEAATMAPPTFFVSDCHLPPREGVAEERKASFLRFLDLVGREGESLYLLGDIFDFWFEYREVVPRYHLDVLTRLKELGQAGIAITLVGGNHDYWAGAFWRNEVGARVVHGALTENLGRYKVYLLHGDGVGSGDLGYKALKAVLRSSVAIRAFSLLHPNAAVAIARWASDRGQPKDEEYRKLSNSKLAALAGRKAAEEGVALLVAGHSHRSELIRTGGAVFLNVGDWVEHFTYGELRGPRVILRQWQRGPLAVETLP